MFLIVLLLAVLWILSPLALIPMNLHLRSEREKLQQQIDKLYRERNMSSGGWSYGGRFGAPDGSSPPNYQGMPQNGVYGGADTPRTPQTALVSPAEQNRLMQERLAEAEGRSVQQSSEPVAEPRHHHNGVDLVKREDKPAQTATQTGAQPTVQPAQPAYQPAAAQTMQQGVPRYYHGGAPMYGQPVYRQPAYGQPVYNGGGQPLPKWAQPTTPKPPKPKRPKKQYSSASVLTAISMTFIVLAGFIFSTAPWVNISDWTRVGLLTGQAALFFGMYVFTRKKLKIEGTSAAMYTLGSVFTTIAYITAGFFGLFGAWFGFEGRGMMLFMALAALIVTLFSARAMTIFQKPFCEYAASVSLAVSGTLVLGQLSRYFERSYAAFALLITAGGTLYTIIYQLSRAGGRKPSKAVWITHIVTRAAYAAMAVPMLILDIAQGAGYGWTLFGWGICLIYIGELLWHAVRKRSEKWLAAHALFVLAGAVSLYLELDDYPLFSLIVTLFAMVGGWVYIYLEKKGKLLFSADRVYLAIRGLFGIAAFFSLFFHSYGGVQFVTAALWVVDFAALAAVKKRQALLIPQCVAVLNLLYELADHMEEAFHGDEGLYLFSLITLLIGIAGTSLYTYLDKKGKTLVKANVINAFMRIVMGLPCVAVLISEYEGGYGVWSVYSWTICGLFIAELTIHSIVKRSQIPLLFQFVFVASAVYAAVPYDIELGGNGDGHRLLCALLLWGICAAGTAVYTVLRRRGKALVKANTALLLIRIYTAWVGVGAVFSVYPEWDWDLWAWLIFGGMAAEMLIYAAILKKESLLCVHALYLTGIMTEIYFITESFPLFALISTAFFSLATLCYFTLWEKNKLRFKAPLVLTAMRTIFGGVALAQILMSFTEWSPYSAAICAILSAETLYYGIRMKEQILVGAHAIFLTMSLAQIGVLLDSYDRFALICCGVAAVGTLAYHILGRTGKRAFETPYVLAGVRIVYGLICLQIMTAEWAHYTWVSLVIWSVTAAELTFYGLRLKNRWILRAQSVAMLQLFGIIASMIGRELPGKYTDVFIFAMLTAAGLVIYRIFSGLYTKTADGLFTTLLFGLGIGLMGSSALPYGVITMFMLAVFVTVDAFDDKHFLSRGMQIVLPLPELITAGMLAAYLGGEVGFDPIPVSMAVCGGVLCAAAFILGLGMGEAKKFEIMKLSTEIGASLALLVAGCSGGLGAGAAILLVSIALYAVMQTSKINIHSLLPMMTVFFGANSIARAVWQDPMQAGDAVIVFSMVMTAVLAVTSRLMFAEGLRRVDAKGKRQWDIPQAGIMMCVLCCLTDSMVFSGRARLFIALLELTVFSANLMRSGSEPSANRTYMTIATGLAAAALVVRPFMVFENSMMTTKIILGIITLFGLAVKKIWAENEKISQEFSQAVFMAAFLLLIVDGLTNQSLANSLIVLSVSLALLIFSFVRKTRRWFLVSAVTLLGLTLYITGDFLSAVAWWAYLLLAGILLIVVAAMTEYFRQRSAKNPQEERFFVDWKW